MEAPAELLAALPVLVTALALLLAWLLVRRGAATASPESPAEASEAPVPPPHGAPEPTAAPEEGQGELAEEEEATEAGQVEEMDPDGERGLPQEGPEEEDGEGTFSFKYSPGKLRGNQYKQMMTKEELEEEQRVQKEQLAAIFKLMEDNKETFGEMSDGDVQEQLRLYDM
ncbi:matrix-remodeling-associated protein 7 [Elephas maximus indicus]|uniref:matrix-remodeling-associated protein 7 n=1 Tax=Elephas maximus indicus TaxID=99487 RepID=UPI00211723BB|nr:matrix-remodeling-associated protein 7 [Elephas maximus indicus]